MMEGWRASVLNTITLQLDLHRYDYHEFVELCLVFLGGNDTINFKRPGALHKARWMAKLLYSIKICLLEAAINQLPPGTITTKHQLPKVKDFVTFATIVYSSWWITCNSAVDAPWNDLKLYHTLLMYEAVNPEVSISAVRAFQRHLWYLTAEMVPLALFSNKVPQEEKRALGDRLLTVKPPEVIHTPCDRFGTGFGKPKFPTGINRSTMLADLVSQDSWFTLQILEIDHEFLAEDVGSRSNFAAYQASVVNVDAMNVVNDCAERGVKLSSDFLAAAKTEEHYQNVLQVVEQDRKQTSNLRKRKSTNDN